VDFQTAVTTVYTQKYADFSGRARRSEYWFAYLAYIVAAVIVNIVASIIHFRLLIILLALAAIVPNLAVGVRRLHDTGRSGWWLLIGIIPIIGWILLIVWMVTDSTPGDNQYGPSPKPAPGWTPNPGQDPSWGQS
jgi:uncharacterized membrane protein YhaH (DUF805 family)